MNVLKVGPQILADGAENPQRGGRLGEGIVQQLHGRYFETGYRGNAFSAANQAAQAVSVALATTYTGFLLYNPIGSGKILVPLKAKFAVSVAPAAIATIGLIQGVQTSAPTGLTALTIQSSQVGSGATGVGKAYSAATITTPTWLMQLVDGFTAVALSAPQPPTDLEGIVQILPGGFLAFGALTAVTGLGSMFWEEVSV